MSSVERQGSNRSHIYTGVYCCHIERPRRLIFITEAIYIEINGHSLIVEHIG